MTPPKNPDEPNGTNGEHGDEPLTPSSLSLVPPSASSHLPDADEDVPAIKFPRALNGTFQRDWRLGSELVGSGSVVFLEEGVRVKGRRTSFIRGGAHAAARVLAWLGFLSFSLAVLLTSIGLGWRFSSLLFLLLGPVILIPAAFLSGWMFRSFLGRTLERWTEVTVPWEKVRRISTEGPSVELDITTPKGRLLAHLRVKGKGAYTRNTLKAIRDGALPVKASAHQRPLRSLWLDRAVVGFAFATTMVGAVYVEPSISAWLIDDGPTHGALAGVPVAMTPDQVEAWNTRSCSAAPTGAPKVVNQRSGKDLKWTIDRAPAGWAVVHALWRAGTQRIEARPHQGLSGTLAGDLPFEDMLGISLVVPAPHKDDVFALLKSGRLDAVQQAHCAGWVGGVDITTLKKPESVELTLVRDGHDLVVNVSGLTEEARLLAIRRRQSPSWAWFAPCEVPQHNGDLGMPIATPAGHRFPEFFSTSLDEAEVWVIPSTQVNAANRLARNGTVQPCMLPASLEKVGWTLGSESTAETDKRAALMFDAAQRARRAARLPTTATQEQVLNALVLRAEVVFRDLGHRARDKDSREALRDGYLSSIEWSAVLDHVSFSHGLPELERTRQRLEGVDPDGVLGEEFLYALAENFLDRNPPPLGEYGPRIAVGEAWINISDSTQWNTRWGLVAVPAEAAAVYQTIGRFVLLDTGLALERHLNDGALGILGTTRMMWPRLKLRIHGITIDVKKSTKRKLLQAWVTGDFGYIFDRVLKKLQEKFSNQEASVQAILASDMELRNDRHASSEVRMSDLFKSGWNIGTVTLLDASRVRLGYSIHPAVGATQQSLDWRGTPVAFMSGSYATGDRKTSGISTTGGSLKNRMIAPDMDGLVLMGDDFGVHMLDMRRGGILPGERKTIRPLHRLRDYSHLMRWLERTKADAFQTHLLYADGERRIDERKASNTKRERRLLVEARFKQNPIIAVVDLPSSYGGYSLYEAMVITERALRSKDPGLQVVGIANLDVGMYNIMQSWNDRGQVVQTPTFPLERAHNIITIALP